MRNRLRAVVFVVLLLCGGEASAYQANCSQTPTGGSSPFQATEIFSQFGEARGTSCSVSCTPDRFHAGIDIGNNCAAGHKVFPIEGGRVSVTSLAVPSIPNCNSGSVKCVRVTNLSTGRAFDYVHVDWTGFITDGDIVTTATQLGTIQSGAVGNHLHLNEKLPGTAVLVNPEFPGRLDFRDTEQPDFVAPTQAPMAGSESVIIVDRNGTTYPTASTYRNGIYYVRGKVDIFATGRNGNDRKGLYRLGTNAYPIVQNAAIPNPPTAAAGNNNLVFGLLQDAASVAADVQSIYWKRQSDADTYKVTRKFNGPSSPQALDYWWDTSLISDGSKNICVYGQNLPQPSYTVASECVNAYVDNTAPTITMTNSGGTVTDGGATSTATITIAGTDSGGIYSIKLEGGVSYSSTNYPSGVQTNASNQFPDSGVLADGSYVATVTDLAGNSAVASFRVDPSSATNDNEDAEGDSKSGVFKSTEAPVLCRASSAGIASIVFNGKTCSFSKLATRACCGPFPELTTGTRTCTTTTRAGVVSTQDIETEDGGSLQMGLRLESDTSDVQTSALTGFPAYALREGTASRKVRTNCITGVVPKDTVCEQMTAPGDCVETFSPCREIYRVSTAGPMSGLSVSNATDTLPGFPVTVEFTLIPPGGGGGWMQSVGSVSYEYSATFSLGNVPQVGQNYSGCATANSFCTALPAAIDRLSQSLSPAMAGAVIPLVKGVLGNPYGVTKSSIVFTSTGTINFNLTGVSTSIATPSIYQWTDSTWSSAAVTAQSVSISSLGILTATGTISEGGYFVLLYDRPDSSAPVTGFNIQGSSLVFDTTLFLSTYSYVVFIATDPAVNGFASGAATSYYRLDPDSTTAYTAYTSSIPVPLGFHTIQYYSVDYAGNAEAPKISSFVVTAGSVFRASEGMRAPGGVLAGFLGSGAQVEVVSAAENDLTVRVSSQNGTPLFTVNNIGGVGVGTDLALGHVDIQGRGSSGETALLLRSGSAAGGSQVQFGYNGDVSMRHQLKTRHSTAAYGNALDFLVWNPGAGSTTTAADLGALSLEGSTLTASGALAHVHPAGQADEELVVSDGVTMGGGTIHRLAAYAPSSLKFKSSVRRLGTREEDRAFEETAALRPARFRYKGEPAGAPLRLGLIYEDAPESLRAEGKTVSVDERVANLELALKASMRRLEALQKRLRELEAP